jgi:hypothetical protein
MSEFPIITIRNEEDVSLLAFHLIRGERVGFTIPIEVSHKENWRLMNMIHDCARECPNLKQAQAA